MPEFAGRHYMNPAYGRAIAQADGDDGDADAQECAKHGNLKQVTVHIQREGGYSVHAHYEHPRAGHHTVESKHATSDEAAEEVKRHLRGHEARRERRSGGADDGDEE
jgi:hypothetical protein